MLPLTLMYQKKMSLSQTNSRIHLHKTRKFPRSVVLVGTCQRTSSKGSFSSGWNFHKDNERSFQFKISSCFQITCNQFCMIFRYTLSQKRYVKNRRYYRQSIKLLPSADKPYFNYSKVLESFQFNWRHIQLTSHNNNSI